MRPAAVKARASGVVTPGERSVPKREADSKLKFT